MKPQKKCFFKWSDHKEGVGVKTGPLRKRTFLSSKKNPKKMWALSSRGPGKASFAGNLSILRFFGFFASMTKLVIDTRKLFLFYQHGSICTPAVYVNILIFMLIGYSFSYIKEKNNPLPPLQMEPKNRFFWINFL